MCEKGAKQRGRGGADIDTLSRGSLQCWFYSVPGLGSILDTVSKDTEDTAPLVSVSVS